MTENGPVIVRNELKVERDSRGAKGGTKMS